MSREVKRVLLITHSVYTRGEPFDPNVSITTDFLNHFIEKDYIFLRHSLYRGGESRLYNRGASGQYHTIPKIGKMPDVFRYVFEQVINFVIVFYFTLRTKKIVVISLDPLNSFIPVFLSKVAPRLKVLFVTPDFTKRRFSNPLLNKIYFTLDKFCTCNCYLNICNSTFVIEEKMNLYKNKISRYLHIPNIPSPWIISKYWDLPKKNHSLVYVGSMNGQIDFKKFFDDLDSLLVKFPDLTLLMAGDGVDRRQLERYVADKGYTHIEFLGQLSHEECLRNISKAQLGLALYNGALDYDRYRDSCKIREYQALSTVPLTTNIVISNSAEIKKYNSGVIVRDLLEVSKVIERVFKDEEYLKELQEGCRKNYVAYDNVFDDLFNIIEEL